MPAAVTHQVKKRSLLTLMVAPGSPVTERNRSCAAVELLCTILQFNYCKILAWTNFPQDEQIIWKSINVTALRTFAKQNFALRLPPFIIIINSDWNSSEAIGTKWLQILDAYFSQHIMMLLLWNQCHKYGWEKEDTEFTSGFRSSHSMFSFSSYKPQDQESSESVRRKAWAPSSSAVMQ